MAVIKAGMLDMYTSSSKEKLATLFYCWRELEGKSELQGGSQSPPRCMLIRSWILRQWLVKYAVRPLPVKVWDMGVFACSLRTEPGGIVTLSALAQVH